GEGPEARGGPHGAREEPRGPGGDPRRKAEVHRRRPRGTHREGGEAPGGRREVQGAARRRGEGGGHDRGDGGVAAGPRRPREDRPEEGVRPPRPRGEAPAEGGRPEGPGGTARRPALRHGRDRPYFLRLRSARSKSSIISSGSSSPTLTRTRPSPIPMRARSFALRVPWVMLAGCSTRVSAPPRLTASVASRTDSTNRRPARYPPFSSI